MTDDEDTLTEIQAAQIPRVDAVGEPAHGLSFVILKAAEPDSLVEADRMLKAKYNASQLRQMGKDGRAFRNPDGSYSYPIGDKDDLGRAVHAIGRGNADHDALRRFVLRRAKQLGASDMIPDNWAADGSIKKAESMSDLAEALDDLDPDGGLIESGDVVEDAAGLVAPTHEGDPDDPDSPAWEAVDAARARAAVEKVSWLKGLVGDMRDREATEAATGDLADAAAAMDLDCVLDALDCALATLAKFAVDEQAEADCRAEEIAEQAAALGIVKAITAATEQITKAGRVLSAANEQSLRAAHAALTEVLGRVPAPAEEAPVAVEKAAQAAPETVEKAASAALAEDDVEKAAVGAVPGGAPTEDTAVEHMSAEGSSGDPEASGTDSASVPAPVSKAAGMDVETLRSMLMKLVRALPDSEVQQAFQSMAGAVNPTGDGGDEEEDSTPETPATEAAPEAAPAPVEDAPIEPPAPAAEDEAMPDDSVQKAAGQPVVDVEALAEVLKAAVIGPLEERTREERDATEARIAKALQDVLGPLEERIAKMEQTPVPGGVILNGQTGRGGPAFRGQDAVVDPLADVKKAIKEIAAEGNSHGAQVAKGALSFAMLEDRLGRRA